MARKMKQEDVKEENLPAMTGAAAVKNLDEAGYADYYEEYGRQAAARPIVGRLLKFSKGDYLAGQDNEEIEEGTELVACMDTLHVGWVKWVDERPVDQDMGPLSEGFKPKRRSELGDDDQDEWETDAQTGKPRDPWQFANQLIMRPVDWDGEEDSQFTFVTQSKGGISAVGELCKYYGREVRQRPGKYPIVALEVDSYLHPNKQYGRIKVPKLTPTEEWVSKEVTKKAAKVAVKAIESSKKGGRRAA